MNNRAFILVVDDEQDFTEVMKDILQSWGYKVEVTQTGYDALQRLSLQKYDVILLDVLMPLINGLETLKRIKRIDREVPVVILTADGRANTAVHAMKLGAYDYITKPMDWERLRVIIKNALTMKGLCDEVFRLRSQLKEGYSFDNIIGKSPKMQEVYRGLEKVIDADVTVSIRGESGTGKELLARAIHFNGPRKNHPFIVVNCAAIPEALLESELFGHERGSFTGAINKRIGKFEQADKGTIFLDEIGEMSKSTQAKILRVLQEKKFERVGGSQPIAVDVRVISATNKDLEEEVKKGNFREDLYYRISVYPIFLPPLRQRREDIPALVAHFMDKFNKKLKKKIKSISAKAMGYLMKYDWPGNVRELENVLERSMLNASGNILLPEHLPITLITDEEEVFEGEVFMDFKRAIALTRRIVPLEQVEKEVLRQALKLTNRNISEAASRLKIGRTTLYRKLKKYDL